MVRESGPPNWANMQWYDAMEAFTAGQAGMIADCGLLRRQLRGSQEVEGRRQGRLCADPGRPGRQDLFGPVHLGAGHQQGDQEQGSGLALRAVGDRAAHPAQRHASAIATTIRPARRSPTIRAFRRSWGRGAAAATSRRSRRTSRRRACCLDTPARAHAAGRHLGARAARDLLQAHVRRRRAEEGRQRNRQGAQGSRHQDRNGIMLVITARKRRRWRREAAAAVPAADAGPGSAGRDGVPVRPGPVLQLHQLLAAVSQALPLHLVRQLHQPARASRCSPARSSSPSASRWRRS